MTRRRYSGASGFPQLELIAAKDNGDGHLAKAVYTAVCEAHSGDGSLDRLSVGGLKAGKRSSVEFYRDSAGTGGAILSAVFYSGGSRFSCLDFGFAPGNGTVYCRVNLNGVVSGYAGEQATLFKDDLAGAVSGNGEENGGKPVGPVEEKTVGKKKAKKKKRRKDRMPAVRLTLQANPDLTISELAGIFEAGYGTAKRWMEQIEREGEEEERARDLFLAG